MEAIPNRQQKILDLLAERPGRMLYEGAAAYCKEGSGIFYLDYSVGLVYEPLRKSEVLRMEKRGLLKRAWADCEGAYILPNGEKP